MKTLIITLALLCALVACDQNVPIQNTYDGVTIGSRKANFHLEAIFDLECPGSAEQNRILNSVLEQIGFNNQTAMYVTYHIFVLPYHYTSYALAVAQHYINAQYGANAALLYQDQVFENMDIFGTNATQQLSTQQVYQSIASFTSQVLKDYDVTQNEIYSALTNRTWDLATRSTFKFCTEKYVSGTPTFWANGVVIDNAYTFTEQNWLDFIYQYTGLTPVSEARNSEKQVDARTQTKKGRNDQQKFLVFNERENDSP